MRKDLPKKNNYTSREEKARKVVQRIRPTAQKHGLARSIAEAYIRENISPDLVDEPRSKWRLDPEFNSIRDEANHYRPLFTPDLSEVYPEDREIIAYEIEDKLAVTSEKLERIKFWIGVTMDGWDEWHLLLILTNRFGTGWHVALDTKKERKSYFLKEFSTDRERVLRHYPDFSSEQQIHSQYEWKNWSFPEIGHFRASFCDLQDEGDFW